MKSLAIYFYRIVQRYIDKYACANTHIHRYLLYTGWVYGLVDKGNGNLFKFLDILTVIPNFVLSPREKFLFLLVLRSCCCCCFTGVTRVDVDSVTLQFGKQFQVFPTRPTCCRCEVQVRCASQFKNLTANDVWYESVWIALWQLASSLKNFVSIAKIMLAPLAVGASLSVFLSHRVYNNFALSPISLPAHSIKVLTLL